MRTAPSAVLLSVLMPVAVVALPVASLPHAAPHAVAPEFRSDPLRGVQLDRVPGGAVRGSARASFQARQEAVPSARGAAPGRPEVLVTRTGVPSFDLLGVTWRAGTTADLTVLVRTHGDSGWSRWTALDATPAPDAREARDARPGTEPLWVGDADGYQVRVDVRRGALPRGLRVDLVDPGSSDADARRAATGRECRRRPRPASRRSSAGPSGAPTSDPGHGPALHTTIQAGFVHHTAGTNAYTAAQVPKILRGIYAYHVKAERLVGHRLQLPGRPVRPDLGGPVRRHRPRRGRCAHRRLQRRHVRRVGDRQLRQGRRAAGEVDPIARRDGVEAPSLTDRTPTARPC